MLLHAPTSFANCSFVSARAHVSRSYDPCSLLTISTLAHLALVLPVLFSHFTKHLCSAYTCPADRRPVSGITRPQRPALRSPAYSSVSQLALEHSQYGGSGLGVYMASNVVAQRMSTKVSRAVREWRLSQPWES